jgi:hypothetical protein
VQHRAFSADDGRDGYDVIGIGGVPHPKKKAQQDDDEGRDQLFVFPNCGSPGRAKKTSPLKMQPTAFWHG